MKLKTVDTELTRLNGMEIVEIVEVDKETYDYEDVGTIYWALMANGERIQVFEDEIVV